MAQKTETEQAPQMPGVSAPERALSAQVPVGYIKGFYLQQLRNGVSLANATVWCEQRSPDHVALYITPQPVTVTDELVERCARAICVEMGWNPDAPVTYAGTRKKVRNRDGSIALQWEMHKREVVAVLTAALPLKEKHDAR